MGESPSLARVPPRFLVDLLEEEAIVGKQGREEEEKEEEMEEKKLGFGCSECVLCSWERRVTAELWKSQLGSWVFKRRHDGH